MASNPGILLLPATLRSRVCSGARVLTPWRDSFNSAFQVIGMVEAIMSLSASPVTLQELQSISSSQA